MAEVTKAHQQVQHRDVDGETGCRVNPIGDPPCDPCRQYGRGDRERRRNDALAQRAAVQPLLDAANVRDVCAFQARPPLERTPLLERERDDDRKQGHRRNDPSELSVRGTEQRKHARRQWDGTARRPVGPDHARGAVRVTLFADHEIVVAANARASRIADGHAHVDVGRINERDNEIAGSVHDHRAMAAVVALPARHRIDPFDPRLFHVAEIDGVVDVAEHVHVAPAQLLQRRVNQHALFAQRPVRLTQSIASL